MKEFNLSSEIEKFLLIEVDNNNLELLRLIRNTCRLFMTRNTFEISNGQQIKWFNNLDKNEYMPFIFDKDGASIGYGAIKIDGEKALVTGGLLPQYRNHGYGAILFRHLIKKSKRMNKHIELEVLKNNIRAIKTYQRLGFSIYEETEKIYKMKLWEV